MVCHEACANDTIRRLLLLFDDYSFYEVFSFKELPNEQKNIYVVRNLFTFNWYILVNIFLGEHSNWHLSNFSPVSHALFFLKGLHAT